VTDGARGRTAGTTALVVGILLIAANLRPAVASVGPVLTDIGDDLGLSVAQAALLTALPVLCFGLLSPLAPVVARRIGLERGLGLSLAGVIVGLVVRIGPSALTLFAGTIVAGSSIAVANVLLPGLIKRDFARHAGLVTAAYASMLGLAASIAAGATVPLTAALGHGWRGGLGFWALPAAVALVAWVPQLGSRTVPPVRGAAEGLGTLLRDRVAWQLTLYIGLQSLGFYSVLAWLPSVYVDHGVNATDAGLLLSVATIVGVPAGLTLPIRAARARDQRAMAAAVSLVTAAGLAGVLVAPTLAPLAWAALIGIGQGSAFPIALTLLVLRARTPEETQRLSAMAQTLGYLLAAAGPLALGALRDTTGAWTEGLALLVALTLLQAVMGLGAGRAGHIGGS
jgi:CP family cyanate transporter-like MFS transporter